MSYLVFFNSHTFPYGYVGYVDVYVCVTSLSDFDLFPYYAPHHFTSLASFDRLCRFRLISFFTLVAQQQQQHYIHTHIHILHRCLRMLASFFVCFFFGPETWTFHRCRCCFFLYFPFSLTRSSLYQRFLRTFPHFMLLSVSP